LYMLYQLYMLYVRVCMPCVTHKRTAICIGQYRNDTEEGIIVHFSFMLRYSGMLI